MVHVLGRFNLPITQMDHGWVNTSALTIIDVKHGKALVRLFRTDDYIERPHIDHNEVLLQGQAADRYLAFLERDSRRLMFSALRFGREHWAQPRSGGPLMVGAALASTLTLLLFFSPALVLGFAIDAAMVLLVASGSWSRR